MLGVPSVVEIKLNIFINMPHGMQLYIVAVAVFFREIGHNWVAISVSLERTLNFFRNGLMKINIVSHAFTKLYNAIYK